LPRRQTFRHDALQASDAVFHLDIVNEMRLVGPNFGHPDLYQTGDAETGVQSILITNKNK
jgi:hypothetical protein